MLMRNAPRRVKPAVRIQYAKNRNRSPVTAPPPTADILKLEHDSRHRTARVAVGHKVWFARCWGCHCHGTVSTSTRVLGIQIGILWSRETFSPTYFCGVTCVGTKGGASAWGGRSSTSTFDLGRVFLALFFGNDVLFSPLDHCTIISIPTGKGHH